MITVAMMSVLNVATSVGPGRRVCRRWGGAKAAPAQTAAIKLSTKCSFFRVDKLSGDVEFATTAPSSQHSLANDALKQRRPTANQFCSMRRVPSSRTTAGRDSAHPTGPYAILAGVIHKATESP